MKRAAAAMALLAAVGVAGCGSTSTHESSPPTTAAPAAVYPPTTAAEVQALGRTGKASALKIVSSHTLTLKSCEELYVTATASPQVSDQQLAADLVAYLLTHQDCMVNLGVFHTGDDTSDGGSPTAGSLSYVGGGVGFTPGTYADQHDTGWTAPFGPP